jgi:hypothetical protein
MKIIKDFVTWGITYTLVVDVIVDDVDSFHIKRITLNN